VSGKGKRKEGDVQRPLGGRTGRESKGIGHSGGKAPSPRILATPLPLAIADWNQFIVLV